MTVSRFFLLAALLSILCPGASQAGVSAQGMLTPEEGRLVVVSPGERFALVMAPRVTGHGRMESRLEIREEDKESRFISGVRGNGFFISDFERIVAIEAPDTNAVPGRLEILDFHGRRLLVREIGPLTDPALSSDGSSLAWRSAGEIHVLDLMTFEERTYPNLAVFGAGPEGRLAGAPDGDRPEVRIHTGHTMQRTVKIGAAPRKVAWRSDGRAIYILTAETLYLFPREADAPTRLFDAPPGAELRDLRMKRKTLELGLRRVEDDRVSGELLLLDPRGRVISRTPGPELELETKAGADRLTRGIPWPLLPNGQHEIGNTYGEYQDYGGAPYMHPGIDAMGAPGQAVHAVHSGEVKAVLTTSGEWHWRVAVANNGGSGTSEGYLYAHLDPATIAVNVGDTVLAGQYLGDLVEWPIYNFTHIHFARVEDSGAQWYGDWLCTGNPHLELDNLGENQAPEFENAQGTQLFAFCDNETDSYQDPGALNGPVDIIVHVGDRIDGNWVCTVQTITYSIYPEGNPQAAVVSDKLAVDYDMPLDTYQGGPVDPFLVDLLYKQDAVCQTYGDYDYREFYHIITNSDGDQVYEESDLLEAWDTAMVWDGNYVVEVTASDAAGNSTTQSMVVTTVNGNIPSDTVGAALSCVPATGTLPFVTSMTATLQNLYEEQSRLMAGRLEVDLAGGQHFGNWRAGFTTVAPEAVFSTSWNQNIPALASLIGVNTFTLKAQDVTPPPWNQPPYAPAGDTAEAACTVTAAAP